MFDRERIFSLFDTMTAFFITNSSMVLPALAMLSVVMLFIGKLYSKIRSKFPIKVNCWFCNSNTSVAFNSSNSWYCPHCDQYNGFSSDGSYNRLLPEQYNGKLNFGSWCARGKPNSSNTNTNGFCPFCNNNLELKIQQLALFVPINQENYDEEIQQYSEQLERVYRLCVKCQVVLDKTLKKKQELYVSSQNHTFKAAFDYANSQPKGKERHSVYLAFTAALSLGLLLSVALHCWADQLFTYYPLPDYINLLVKDIPTAVISSVLPLLGVLVQIFDCFHMRDAISFVNLLLWIILLSLHHVPVQIDGLVSIVQILASIVFFITLVFESRKCRQKSIAAVKPVQLHKLDDKVKTKTGRNSPIVDPITKPLPPKSPVSDPIPIYSVSDQSHKLAPDDFGFSKLNVSSRRITRSQTKPFQTKQYKSPQNDLFKPKPINLSPPKLQFDKTFEYQVPLTRSSSQSSGFVSMSHQKDFDDEQSPSFLNENMESVSQCSERALAPYHHPAFPPPTSFSHAYGMPFSQFQPYAIMHFNPHLNKVYQYSNVPFYEPSMNFSTSTVGSQQSFENRGWFYYLKNTLSSLLVMFLLTSNIAVLWKVFGEDYFKR